MHLVTASAAPAATLPTLPDGCKLIGKTPHIDNGLTWQAYENRSTFQYGFVVSTGYISAAEHPTAAPAERAARRWCAAFVADPVFDPAPALEVVGAEAFDAAVFGKPEPEPEHNVSPDPAPAIEPLGTHEIAGWRIEVSEGRPGTFKADLFHAATGKAGALDQNFTGKDSARTALTDASIWAMQHAADVPRISAKIDGEVVDLEEIHGEANVETELWEMVRESLGEEVPGTGWYVATVDGKRGTFNAHLLREDGVVCPERFDGHTTPDGAAAEACEWARANPVAASGGLPDAADDIVAGWRVIVGNDASDDGAFMVECVAQENGVVVGGAGDFAGFNGSEEACDYGRKYAANNPAPGNTSTVVAGWVISTEQGPTRKFEAILIDGSTGKLGALAEDFSGYDTGDDAVEAGTTWAIANPTDAAVAEANELWSHVDAARRPALEADMSRAADRLDQDAADLRAELARVTRERDEARAAHARDTKACNAVAVDLAWNTKRKGELEARIADDRDELKGVVKRLKELETEVQETLEAVGTGKQVPLFPTVTIEGPKVSSPAVTSVTFTAGDRKKLDAALRDHDGRRPAAPRRETTAVLTTTWHHAGVDYALESSELPGGQWRSCIHGHEAATEAFERSREEAEAACKAAAVVVFEMKIGGTREAVAAAMAKMIDPAVRMPAKRGRKPRTKAGAA